MLISAHVVNQVCQGVSGGIPGETDDAAEHPVQVQLAVPEHMLHTHPRLGILPVDRFLLLAEHFPSHTALDDAILHMIFAHHAFYLLPDICAVGMQILPSVVIVYQQLDRNGVMLLCTRGHSLLYQLAPGIDFRVVLVAVIFLIAFAHLA